MTPQEQVVHLLDIGGAVLVRSNGHRVYRFPDGTNWVTPSTPSDCRSWKNNLADLRRRLGVRADKKVRTPKTNLRASVNFQPSDKTVWREYLTAAGVQPL